MSCQSNAPAPPGEVAVAAEFPHKDGPCQKTAVHAVLLQHLLMRLAVQQLAPVPDHLRRTVRTYVLACARACLCVRVRACVCVCAGNLLLACMHAPTLGVHVLLMCASESAHMQVLMRSLGCHKWVPA